MDDKYTLQNFKQIFDNYEEYSFIYEINQKIDSNWKNDLPIKYYNIIVEIKDKNNDYIFYTDDTVFDLKIGENIICKMCLDILIGDYNINLQEINYKLINMDTFENQFLNSLQIH